MVGASAGGLEPLRELVSRLPAHLEAAVLVVLHLAPSAVSRLAQILDGAGPLPARSASNGAPLVPGTIHVAPPDHHLLVHGNGLRLSRGPRINGMRPAIDALFLSAARWMGARTISVILSGSLDDGTAGSRHVRAAGGFTVAQDPVEALYPPMPRNAIEGGGIMHVRSTGELAELIVAATREEIEMPRAPSSPPDRPDNFEDVEGMLAFEPEAGASSLGSASGFTCPDCHGALWEVTEDQLLRFRCRIGHAFGSESLFASQSEKIEEAMWAGYRALEESAALAKRLAERAEASGLGTVAQRWRSKYEEAIERVETLRTVLESGQLVTNEENHEG